MKRLIVLLVSLFMLVCCSGGGGGGSDDKKKDKSLSPVDPCAGPVPCMDLDWSDQFAVFYDSRGDPYIVGANGHIAAIAGYWTKDGDRALIAFTISQPNCRSGNIGKGQVDVNEDGTPDLELSGVSGKVEICDDLLEIFDVICNEYEPIRFYDVMAWYDGMSTLSVSGELHTEMPIGKAEVDDVKIRIELVKELLKEEK